MHAGLLKKIKLQGLKELMKKIHKLDAGEEFTKNGVGPSTDELADEEEEDIEGDDADVAMPTSLAMGKIVGSDDEEDDEDIPGQRAFMKRSNQAPVKGKTKMITISVSAKPMAKMGKMKA